MNGDTLLEKVIDHIEENLEEDLSLDKISKDLNYSKYYIARAFVEKTQCTVYKYIQGRRLTLAAWKLVETPKPIIEIAYEARYNSQQAFTLAFRRLYRCTPQTYRKNGVFYPLQTRIGLVSTYSHICNFSFTSGGKMAA